MKRKTVPHEELLRILNQKLADVDECQNCRIRGVHRLREPDEHGCNWDREATLSCSGTPTELCLPHAARILGEVADEYNIDWPTA